MLRRLSWLILPLLALGAGAPYVVGQRAEAEYEGLLERLEQDGFVVEGRSYRRGWLASEAEARLLLPETEASAGASRLHLTSTLQHGPITSEGLLLAAVDSRIKIEGAGGVEAAEGEAKTRILYDGHSRLDLHWPGGRMEGGPGERVRVVEAKAVFEIGPGQTTLRGSLSMDALETARADDSSFSANKLTLEVDSRQGPAGLMVGRAVLSTAELQLHAESLGEGIWVQGLRVDLSAESPREEIIGFVAGYRLQGVRVDGQEYGPGELQLEAENLHAPTLAAIQRETEHLVAQGLSAEQLRVARNEVFGRVAPALLEFDPGVRISPLRIETTQGRIEGRFEVRSQGLRWAEVKGMGDVINAQHASAWLQAPRALVLGLFERDALHVLQRQAAPRPGEGLATKARSMAEQRLGQLVKQGFLAEEGEILHFRGGLDGGMLDMNGKKMPLALLAGGMGMKAP